MVKNELLRRDVRMLGDLLGDVIADLAGPESFALVEDIRQLARSRRSGDPSAEPELAERIRGLSDADARVVSRAFSIFFDLANLAEDLQRVRVLRARERDQHPEPLSESIGAAIGTLREAGFSADEVQHALSRLAIELVFTAHPSEAKRRSIRAKLRRMRLALEGLDKSDLLPRERQRLERQLRTELTILWQTEFLRPWRPTVLQEVERGLSIMPRLWEVVPLVYDAMRHALETYYPGHAFELPLFLRFGSWMGGDRDGNPNVTVDITARTLLWLRETAVTRHLAQCKLLYDYLTVSINETEADPSLAVRLEEAQQRWPALAGPLEAVSPSEVYRRWLTMIQFRLAQSQKMELFAELPPAAYRDGHELEADLQLLCSSLAEHHGRLLLESEVQKWLDQVRVFGLHLTRLDVRQDARRLSEVMTEILARVGVCPDFAALSEPERQQVLTRTLSWKQPIDATGLAPLTQDTLSLFRLLRWATQALGAEVLGGHVISLTQQPSDILSLLWLWRAAQTQLPPAQGAAESELAIIPLFEKIGDLKHASETLDAILSHTECKAHLSRLGNRQIVMVGYSDSTKDGGYLAACWGLYRAQSELHAVAEKHGVQLTFFHGRGGSLGRGGGPAARGILSLPHEALDGTLRLTEQGEVLAERYDDQQIAYRHLEQVTWATLLASAVKADPPPARWVELMEELSRASYQAYRDLVERPGFIQFFSTSTPIDEIENLPIGSRPARRRGERSLGDLRAIPWVFAWTQNRSMIPAWYGLGAAVELLKNRDREAWNTVRNMYRQWPFFQATIDNAALALAKAEMFIAEQYAELSEPPELKDRFWPLLAGERQRTRQALEEIVGANLLATTPWLQQSIEARNPYIDPLNLIQIELMRRKRALEAADSPDAEQLRGLLRLSVQGIAAGMRTTG